MRKMLLFLMVLSLGALGCGKSTNPSKEKVREVMNDPKDDTARKPAGTPAAETSVRTWTYFFAASDKASLQGVSGAAGQHQTSYRVEKVVSVRGEPGVKIAPDSVIVRLDVASRLHGTAGAKPALLFQGVPQHLEYTTQVQRDELNRRSRAELPPSKDTVAVVIPIRKSAAWWALALDQRHAHFQKMDGKVGHTAIGAGYVDRIYRKLYHSRYSVETTDYDFITYFEFQRVHATDFTDLLAKLRDPQLNPEWNFVDREYEIWMTKVE
jgi:Chlorite dismutase